MANVTSAPSKGLLSFLECTNAGKETEVQSLYLHYLPCRRRRRQPFRCLLCPLFSQRQKLYEMAGAGQTPYLIDPNTGAKGYESAEINDYLESTYAL